MATSTTISHTRRASRRTTTGNMRWMSERQLDAYLQARETLRRVSALARSSAQASQPAAPPSPV